MAYITFSMPDSYEQVVADSLSYRLPSHDPEPWIVTQSRPGSGSVFLDIPYERIYPMHCLAEMGARQRREGKYVAKEMIAKDLGAFARDPRVRNIVIDMRNVLFINAGMMQYLIALDAFLAQEHGGRVVLCNPSPPVKELLKFTLFHRLIPIMNSAEAAWKSVN